ncbi:MAG: phosphopentomutase [Gemmatimonadota bacterium]|nr:phosphopentomutase [Gemmatimonadota bacterium]
MAQIFSRVIVIVLDSVGIGELDDAAGYGDKGSNTLGNIARAVGGLRLPNLQALGLGNIATLQGVAVVAAPTGAWGSMQPQSAGKDSTTGHWEIAGVHLAQPFPTYPNGFPVDVIDSFSQATGRAVLGNCVASGTSIIDEFALQQKETGAWIVYTSADSVFQVAAHEDWIPLAELYSACKSARTLLVAPNNVSRVIARPYTGQAGQWKRTPNRRDYSVAPTAETLLDALASAGIPRGGVGKVDDLFAGRNLTTRHTENNAAGLLAIHDWLNSETRGFCWANLVDFDQLYGHRNDIRGFSGALVEFDRALPQLLAQLKKDDLLFITADHGNDPTTPSTDHARERVPLLVAGPSVKPVPLGVRSTFSDVGATVADWFGAEWHGAGQSFLSAITHA